MVHPDAVWRLAAPEAVGRRPSSPRYTVLARSCSVLSSPGRKLSLHRLVENLEWIITGFSPSLTSIGPPWLNAAFASAADAPLSTTTATGAMTSPTLCRASSIVHDFELIA